jgi:hypothetical protein
MNKNYFITKLDFIVKNIRGVNDVLMYVVVASFFENFKEREMIR